MFSSARNSSNDAPPPYSNQSSSSETSLTTLLPTQSHRIQCALLLLLCTDAVKADIVATFELPETMRRDASSKRVPPGTDLLDLGNTQSASGDPRHTLYSISTREEELASSEVKELRRASLQYFDSWRGKVLRRLCDALGVRAEAVRIARKQHQAQAERRHEQGTCHEDLIQWAVDQNEPEEAKKAPRYPRTKTELFKLDQVQRVSLLECLLLLILSLETYPAHSRILLLHLCSSLHLDASVLVQQESQIAQGLLTAASQMSAEKEKKSRAAENAVSSKWKIGLATVGGAVLLGVTGGLAAPLLVAGFGSVLGGLGLGAVSTLLGALASNTLLIGGLFGAYGGKMTGQMMERYEKEVEDFKFLPVRHSLAETSDSRRPSTSRTTSGSSTAEEKRHKLRVAIGISGALTTESDMILPWSILDKNSVESFALRWEVVALMRLGVSLSSVLASYAWQYAKWELARRTLFSAVAAGLWPLGLLKMARIVDNPFSVARARANKAGKVLADALINKCQGERPVTLIGFSVGARVIYSCLLELADRKAFGLIESVVLMGAPAPSDAEPWTKIRSVVSGRVVNCFSTEDYILGLLYRASSAQLEVAGLQAITDVNGVENFDFSESVKGHTRYRYMVGQILQQIGFDDVDPSEVEREFAILKALDNEEAEEQRQRGSADAAEQNEIEQIELRVRDRTGAPAHSHWVDEREERRRQELLLMAEEREVASQGGPPPSYEDMPGKSPAVMNTLRAPPLADVETLTIETAALGVVEDDNESVISEAESIHSSPLEMLHVAPVPESDDEEEVPRHQSRRRG